MKPRLTLFGTFVKKTFQFKLLPITATVLLAVTAVVVSVHSSSQQAAKVSAPAAKSGENPRGELQTHHTVVPGSLLGPAPAPPAPIVTASKADSLFTDVDGDLQADPGDTIKYTVNINSAGGDATGVTFTDTVDPNTMFVPGSLTATPVAVDDSYSATGNIRISVAAPGVLGNDFTGVPAATITAPPTTSTNGGDVTLNADGSFTYNPPAGFEGTDTFSYTLTNASGSNNATVSITVSGMIWFIDNNAAACTTLAAGCGRLTNPFSSLSAFAALNNGSGNNPAANDNIFVYESASDYAGPVTLLNGQRFIGQDATASLSTITGLTPPAGSDPLPTMNSANGTIVNITTGNAITVGSGNTLRGFTGGNSTTDISGTSFGTLTISDVTLNGQGQALNLTTGTLAATFGSISSTNSGTTGISLTSVAGSLTSPTTSITNPTGIGISVGTSSATLDFGNTTSTASGGTGVSLLTNTGAITFGALNISPDASQRGLLATDNTNTITSTSGTISNTGAIAVEITRTIGTTPLVVSLTSVSSDGGVNGIKLNSVNGSFTVTGTGTTAGSGGTIQNKTSNGVEITSASNITLTNMNLPNDAQTQTVAGSSTQCGGNLRTGNNLSCVAGIYLSGVVGVTLTNVSVTGSKQMGINGNNVTTFTMSNSTITGNGDEASEDGLTFQNLKGTCSITDSMIKDNAARQIVVTNIQNSSTLTMGITGTRTNIIYPLMDTSTTEIGKTVQTNTFTDQSILFDSVSTATSVNMTLNLTGVVFKNSLPGNSVLFSAVAGTGTIGGTTTNCSFDNTAGGVILQAQNGMSGNYDVTNSEFNKVNLQSILFAGLNPYNGALTGKASGNHIGEDSNGVTPGSACEPLSTGNCHGIDVNMVGGTGSISTRIDGNVIQQFGGIGILVQANGNGSPDVNVNIENNTLKNPAGPIAHGIQTNIGTTTGANVDGCLGITGNTVTGTYEDPGVGTEFGISTRVRFLSTHRLPGYGGSATAVGGPGNAVTDFIIGGNTTGGKVFTQRSAPSPGYLGGAACVTPLAPLQISKTGNQQASSSGGSETATPAGNSDTNSEENEDILWSVGSNTPEGYDPHKLTQVEVLALAQAAIDRWREAGISAEDLMRLQSVTFEITDLPDGQLATGTSTNFKIDETAAGYGWYADPAPMEDTEFDLPVPGKELQTTELSLEHGSGMDLLTALMRQLGTVYLRDNRVPMQLRPLMQNTLSPAVRRLPDSRTIQLPSSKGKVSGLNRTGSEKGLAATISKRSALRSKSGVATSPSSIRNVAFNSGGKRAAGRNSRLMHHVPRSTAPMLSSMLADVMLNIGTLPSGESVTITFNVTVNNPFTGAMAQVSNQGTVSGSNFADVLTDDPTVGGTADPTVTPIDLPDVSVAVSPASVAEDGATNLVYTFTRNGSTANALTVNFSVGGTADFGASPNDYTQTGAATFTSTSGTVTFGAGNSTAVVTVNPETDTTVEPDETVVLTVTSGIGYEVGAPSSASGTISNDDTDVSVAVSPASVAEDGATNLVYTFTRVGVTTNSLTVNFSIALGGSNAVFPVDYSQSGATTFAPPLGTVTFGAGNSTAIVTVDPAADVIVEPDETVIFTVTSGAGYNVGSPSVATGTITNDDAEVSVAVAPSSVTEDGPTNLVYTFTRTGFTAIPVTVNFSVGGSAVFSQPDYSQTGAATYSDTSGTVLFGAGDTTATVTIDPAADLTVEPDETVVLTVTSGVGYNVGSPDSATGTITNDDTDVSVAVSPGSVAEDGATNLVYTFTRVGVTSGALTVNFSVGGSAVFSQPDYTQTGAATYSDTSGTVVFGAGNSTASVTINPSADATVEPDETVILTVTSGAGYNVGSPSSASGTIVNDDTDVSIAVAPASVAEDGVTNLVYTFTRVGVTSGALTVNFSVGGTADFGASPNDYTQTGATTFTSSAGTVTFGAGNSTASVTVDPETDTTIEPDETVILTVTSGAGYNVSSPSSATGTITNDDADVSVVVSPASVAEDGATNLVYTFTRTGFTAGALTVNFNVGGTATFGVSPDDYTQTGATTFTTTTGSVTFAPGSPTAQVTVDPETDTTAEADETVIITLVSGPSYNAVSPDSATGTILNDDTLVSVVVSPSSTTEGGANLVYTFTRTGPTTSAVTANFSVGGSASFPGDYSQSGAATFTPPTATVTFGVGSSTATVTVTPLSDCTVEGSETVEFTVQPGSGYGVGSPSMATGTINNTPDSSPPTITLIPNVNMTLWPPNHDYHSVAVTDFVASASDDCDPSVNINSVYILKITSDEAEDGPGDGSTLNDILIGATCKTAQLRAERQNSGDGRVYTITFKVKDSTGNFSTATAQVTVRTSPGNPAVDSGTAYTVNSACP